MVEKQNIQTKRHTSGVVFKIFKREHNNVNRIHRRWSDTRQIICREFVYWCQTTADATGRLTTTFGGHRTNTYLNNKTEKSMSDETYSRCFIPVDLRVPKSNTSAHSIGMEVPSTYRHWTNYLKIICLLLSNACGRHPTIPSALTWNGTTIDVQTLDKLSADNFSTAVERQTTPAEAVQLHFSDNLNPTYHFAIGSPLCWKKMKFMKEKKQI